MGLGIEAVETASVEACHAMHKAACHWLRDEGHGRKGEPVTGCGLADETSRNFPLSTVVTLGYCR